MSFESTDHFEKSSKISQEIPTNHLEKCENKSDIEKMTLSQACETVGKRVFLDIVSTQKGLLGEYKELTGSKDPIGFAKKYSEFITNPSELKETDSQLYEYFKDRIFGGREFDTKEAEGSGANAVSFEGIGNNPCIELDIVASGKNINASEKTNAVSFEGAGNNPCIKLDVVASGKNINASEKTNAVSFEGIGNNPCIELDIVASGKNNNALEANQKVRTDTRLNAGHDLSFTGVCEKKCRKTDTPTGTRA